MYAAVAIAIFSAALEGCESDPQASEKSVAPTAVPHVQVEPIRTPPIPSDSGRIVIVPAIAEPNQTPPTLLGLQEKTLSEGTEYLKRILEYPTIVSIGGRSFKEFMQEKGYEYSVHELESPLIGRVVPPEGLVARPLPTTEATVRSLPARNSLKHDARVKLQYFVRVKKTDGSREEVWVAQRQRIVTPGNPDVGMMVFYAVEITERGRKEAYISPMP